MRHALSLLAPLFPIGLGLALVVLPRTAEARSYGEIGGSFGTPAGLHLVGGYRQDRFGTRLTAGYLGSSLYGVQLGAGLRRDSDKDGTHGFDLNLGTLNVEGAGFRYVEPAYSYHGPRGFFAEVGLALGVGDYSNPQLMFQIGGMGRVGSDHAPAGR
jgi:hypothetical protein